MTNENESTEPSYRVDEIALTARASAKAAADDCVRDVGKDLAGYLSAIRHEHAWLVRDEPALDAHDRLHRYRRLLGLGVSQVRLLADQGVGQSMLGISDDELEAALLRDLARSFDRKLNKLTRQEKTEALRIGRARALGEEIDKLVSRMHNEALPADARREAARELRSVSPTHLAQHVEAMESDIARGEEIERQEKRRAQQAEQARHREQNEIGQRETARLTEIGRQAIDGDASA